MPNDLALGLDLGTSALKALVLDDACHVVGVATRPYPLRRPAPGLAEQDPHDWWSAAVAAVGDLAARGVPLDRIAGIGLSGQMHGLVLAGQDGDPLLPCHTWADTRCAAEVADIERVVGAARLRSVAGSGASTSATAAKLLWLRRNLPDVYERARFLLLPKDYLRLRLTGQWATDVTDASGTLLCDVRARDWSDELVAALDLRRDLLPPMLESGARAGALTSEGARALGLRAGLPVVAGAGDAEAAAVGVGLSGAEDDRGTALATLGTGGQFFVATQHAVFDHSGWCQTLCHAIPGRWHLMTAILAGASALAWLAGLLAPDIAPGEALTILLGQAASEPPGARGVFFLPHLNGVRLPISDPSASAAFIGLRPDHTRATLVRAALEGVAFALRDGLAASRTLGIGVDRVRLAGAANRARLWPQIQAGVFGVPVETGVSEDASAVGAAMLAAAAVGLLPSLDAGARLVSAASNTIVPDPDTVTRYEEHYRAWRRFNGSLYAAYEGIASTL